MTYPTRFTTTQKEILNEMIPAISNMKPGKSLIVEHQSVEEINRRRYLLYAWLSPNHANKKEIYTIRTLSPTSFLVVRRHEGPAIIKATADDAERFVMDHLLDVVDPNLALDIIRKHDLDPTEQEAIYREWKEKIGAET